MPTSYVFNSVLNLKKCFQNTPPPTLSIDDLPQLPKDWLSELENQCRKIRPNLEKNIFLKHVGPSSKYKLKAVLLKQVSFIFYQISNQLLPVSVKHESSKLLLQLTEDINECTAGFHIRVNKLINSLQVPDTLEQLLYLVNYQGAKEEYYKSAAAESMVSIIKKIFSLTAIQKMHFKDFFICQPDQFGDPTLFYNIDWSLIRQLFFQKLIGDNYFTKVPDPANLIEYAYFQTLFPKQASRKKETQYINNYLKNQNYAVLLDELISIQNKFPKYWLKIIRNLIIIQNINNFFEFVKTQSWNEANAKQLLKQLNLIYLLFFSQNIKFILSRIIRNPQNLININYNLLYKSVKYRPKVTNKFLNIFFNQQKNSHRFFFDLLFHENSESSNLLMLAVQYNTKILRHILFLLNQQSNHCEKEKILALFNKQNNNGWNLLSLAAKYNANALQFIFDFLKGNSHYFDTEILCFIFHKKMNDGSNFLQVLVRYQSIDQINSCLNFISEKFQFSNKKKWLDIIVNKDHTGHLLCLVTRSKNFALSSILNFMSKHIEQLDIHTLQYCFSYQNNKGWHCLHNAACSDSLNLKLILDFIHKHIDQFDDHSLRCLFLAQNQDQENFLQLAVHYQSAEAVDSIFKFFSQHIELFDKASLQHLLLQQNSKGWSLLSMAYRQPANLKLILDFINEYSDSVDAETIKKIILQKNEYDYTCLHYAARSQPDSLEIILDFIDQHFAR